MTSTIELSAPAVQATGLERTRYFPRQLVTSDDLSQDQWYVRERLRRHNRLLHGWGVVCGAVVSAGKSAGSVVISPGYILGPQGDDIYIEQRIAVDVCKSVVDAVPCGQPKDPWCQPAVRRSKDVTVLYLAVRYAERLNRPVRVLSGGCGCEENNCEYSRYQDAFEIGVLTALPASHDPMPGVRLSSAVSCDPGMREQCIPCPSEPWVVLANIQVDAKCDVKRIDNTSHRRYVASFAAYYFQCKEGKAPPVEAPSGDWIHEVDVKQDAAVKGQVLVEVSRDTWSFLPVRFDVEEGDTFGSLVEREGARTFRIGESEQTITLAELYQMAGVDMSQSIKTLDAALAPLEGLKISGNTSAMQRKALIQLLDKEGIAELDREYGGRLEAVAELPSSAIRGLGKTSLLGENIAELNIRDIAQLPEAEFMNLALKNVPENRQKATENQALEIYARARRVAAVAAFRNDP